MLIWLLLVFLRWVVSVGSGLFAVAKSAAGARSAGHYGSPLWLPLGVSHYVVALAAANHINVDRHGENRVVQSVPVLPQAYEELVGEPMLWLCLLAFSLGAGLVSYSCQSGPSSTRSWSTSCHASAASHPRVNDMASGLLGNGSR